MRRVFAAGLGAGVLVLSCGQAKPPPVLDNTLIPEDAGSDMGDDATSSGDGTGTFGPPIPPSDDPTSCAEAAASKSYVGCDYWPTVLPNNVWSIFDYAVVVANAGTATAT